MKKIIAILFWLAVPVSLCFAASNSKIETRVSVNDGTTNVLDSGLITKYFSNGATQQQTIVVSADVAKTVTVPSGAKGVLFDIGSSRSLHLKGVATDIGISLDSSCPILIPLSADNAQIVLSSDGAVANVKAFWL